MLNRPVNDLITEKGVNNIEVRKIKPKNQNQEYKNLMGATNFSVQLVK